MRALDGQVSIEYVEPAAPSRLSTFLRQGWWLAALLAPWALLVPRLSYLWGADPQYAYAWSVPFLAAVLALLRWPAQPRREPLRIGGFLFLSAALILPFRLVQEAAPEWSAANWSLALAATLATFLYLCRTGGARWACWFLFPLLFLLTAVPWPQRFDLWLTQSLMRGVAALTVELLGWMNIPAFRQGNLICLPAGPIGIDEACSGIRSLQAMLMVSLFLGDLCRLPARRRFLLLAAGLALAFAGNVARTTMLSSIAARAGLDAIHRWHDPAGFSVLCFGLCGAWLLASRWRGPALLPPSENSVVSIPLLPTLIPAGLVLSLLAVETGVQLWYHAHESGSALLPLTISWPAHEDTYRPLPIPDAARQTLLFSSGDAAAWQDGAGRAWCLYHLTWAPGRTASQSARLHNPETCLAASGAVLTRDFGRREVSIAGGSLSFRAYRFQEGGAPLYVLFSLYEQHPADRGTPAALHEYGGWSRIRSALAGQRNLGQESVELGLRPSPAEPDPIAAMTARLASLVSLAPARP